MKKKPAKTSPKLTKYTATLLAINLAIILLIYLLKDNLPPVVPLLYGKPQGEEQLVPKLALTVPSIIATLTIILNFAIARIIENNFLKYVLLGLMITATTLSTITVIKIFFLVGNL